MTWWYENEEEEMKLYKDEDLCIECKNDFFSKPYDHRDPTPGTIGYCIKCDNFLIKEKKMEFDKSRIYGAVNADELKPGDKVIVSDCLRFLRQDVKEGGDIETLKEVLDESHLQRFKVMDDLEWGLAYLVERKENCTNCGEGEWDKEHKEIHCNPAMCGNGNIVFRNQEVEVCEYWKPKTKRAEKKYRPFKDTDELIKVWDVKYRYAYGLERINNGLDMPNIWVRNKSDRKVWLINEFDNRILDYLFTNCEFLDGSPCGVEEQ